jgi:hypothetical protein
MDTRERQDIRKERNKQHLPSPHAGGPESAEGMGNGMSQTDPHCVIHTLALFPTSMFFNPRPAPGHVPTQFAGDQSTETQDIGTPSRPLVPRLPPSGAVLLGDGSREKTHPRAFAVWRARRPEEVRSGAKVLSLSLLASRARELDICGALI